MKTYSNITIENAESMNYSELMDAVKTELAKDGIEGENATIIADLMIRYDKDVIESDGQFYCYSAE